MPLHGPVPVEGGVDFSSGRRAAGPRLGEIFLAAGEISERQLRDALARKRASGRRVGEELVAAGVVSADRLTRALRLQRKLVLTALLGALFSQANAAETRAYMSVTANVVDTVGIRSLHQVQDIVVSASDVERGFIEIAAASRMEVRNPGPSVFEFRGVSTLFRRVRISGSAGTAEFGSKGGTLLAQPNRTGLSSVALDYRFELSPDTQPGKHKWPLAITVLPL